MANRSLFATHYSLFALLRLSAGVLPRLRHLHFRIGHHQSAFIRERDKLETHVDGAHRALGAAAMDTGVEAALAAFLHDLLVDPEDFRLITVELRHQSIREAEIGRTDINAVDALDVENRFHIA